MDLFIEKKTTDTVKKWSIHRFDFPNSLILNEKLIINCVCSYVTVEVFISVWCCNSELSIDLHVGVLQTIKIKEIFIFLICESVKLLRFVLISIYFYMVIFSWDFVHLIDDQNEMNDSIAYFDGKNVWSA